MSQNSEREPVCWCGHGITAHSDDMDRCFGGGVCTCREFREEEQEDDGREERREAFEQERGRL